jgi:hypothetical protein
MRYISAPQRSQGVGASDAGAAAGEVSSGVMGGRPLFGSEAEAGSDIGRIMAWLANRSSKLREMSTSAASQLRRTAFA